MLQLIFIKIALFAVNVVIILLAANIAKRRMDTTSAPCGVGFGRRPLKLTASRSKGNLPLYFGTGWIKAMTDVKVTLGPRRRHHLRRLFSRTYPRETPRSSASARSQSSPASNIHLSATRARRCGQCSSCPVPDLRWKASWTRLLSYAKNSSAGSTQAML